jgi:pimeloyl-ACP methyl ester carboxylesterase
MTTPTKDTPTIFRSAAAEQRVLRLYDDIVDHWPVPLEALDLDVPWATVHVLAWGPTDGAPLLLCHAASMAATSWLPNAQSLAEQGRRCYAVDYPGEANRSRLTDRHVYPKSGQDLGRLYAAIMDALELDRAAVAGASAGGHVALRLAQHAPERVERLALMGPMGITDLSIGAMLRMMLASMVPRPSVASRTSRWALGTAAPVTESYGAWFAAVLEAVATPPRVARPVALKPEELSRIEVPVLLVLGTSDNLVGDAERAAGKATALPDVQVETLQSSHLVAVERAPEVNALLERFLA